MKRIKTLILVAVGLVAAIWSPAAMATWGPTRPTYTMDSPAPAATFNSITDNPVLGDERDFVRIVEADNADAKFSNEVKLEEGKKYTVYIGYHNDAATETNYDGTGIAQRVRVASQIPTSISAGESAVINVIISAVDATPEKVWDDVTLTSDEDLTIEYVPGSAVIHNNFPELDGTTLSDDVATTTGTYIGVKQLDGVIYGCAEYSGHILYDIVVKKEGTPPPPPPEELPKTGPAEIVMATAIVAGICGGAFYLYRTKRTLKKVTENVSGKNIVDDSDIDSESGPESENK